MALRDSIFDEALLEEVVDACIKHLRDQPRDHEVLFHLGNAFFLKSLFDKASFCFVKAVNINPKSPSYYMHMGHSYRKMGDKDQAVAAYESVLTLNPRFADAHFNMGLIFFDNRHFNRACSTRRSLSIAASSKKICPSRFSKRESR
jgi:tetratricopeptide (TPR) repeat protein